MKGVEIKYLDIISDDRGWLVEVLKYSQLSDTQFGHLHLTVVAPGQTRGGHYHKLKNEWFFVIKGEIEITMENINNGEKEVIPLSDKKPTTIKFPPFIKHTFINKSDKSTYIIAYSDKFFDRENPDAYRK